MQLQHRTWIETEAYLETCRGIIVPIGSTEQHGPNGLIGTDALCAEVIARGVGEATGAMVAPTISVGMAQHHMAFAGTITYRPSTLIAVIRDTVVALAEHGFDRFLFVNGHGGNIATIAAAFSEIWNELRQTHRDNAPGLALHQLETGCGTTTALRRIRPGKLFANGAKGSHGHRQRGLGHPSGPSPEVPIHSRPRCRQGSRRPGPIAGDARAGLSPSGLTRTGGIGFGDPSLATPEGREGGSTKRRGGEFWRFPARMAGER